MVKLSNGKIRVLVKGAPEIVVKFCSHYADGSGGLQDLGDGTLGKLSKAQDEMSNGQKRVICLAHKVIVLPVFSLKIALESPFMDLCVRHRIST